jgi:DNA integrity scanning protein DisA with diadenylate cyclase activity/mannitol/fructose-specific phosphotransferase system IIA component (Ntr-type)
MRLDRFIARSRIIEIQSPDLLGALEELAEVAVSRLPEKLNPKTIAKSLLERETTMATYLGDGVGMPHMRVSMKRRYIFAVGRTRTGLKHETIRDYEDSRLIFLLLASDQERNYLNALASLARLFRDRELVQHILEARTTKDFKNRVVMGFGGELVKPERRQTRFNRLFLKEAEKVARDTHCAAVVIFSDTFTSGIELSAASPNFRTIVVTRGAADRRMTGKQIDGVIEVRSYSQARLSQIRSAILIGLTRGLFKYTDRLCCVGGLPSSNLLDTVMVIDIEREFQKVIDKDNDLLPSSVKIEVMERIIAIATELSIEGREGHAIGTLFVIGDTEKVLGMAKPLVMNPFYGYKEEERNVLNPFMDETVKEYSQMDGCFIIRGDGVVESAGSLIHTPTEFQKELPSGYGARHSAAASISLAAECVAVLVSASTGQVTIFRKGVMFPLFEKSAGVV